MSAGATAKILGARVRRVEDPRVLLGEARYVDDVPLRGVLSVAFLRSSYARARIASIDGSAARSMPGVTGVWTAEDLAGSLAPLRVEHAQAAGGGPFRTCEWPVLASGTVRFVGEAVAAVVADDRYLAEDAVERIDFDFDPLEAVADMEAALAPGAPLVHDEWGDNVFQRVAMSNGDVAGAFRGAAVVVAERFATGRHLALPIETRGCVASFERGSGELTFWSSTQMPHVLRSELSRALALPESRVRVIAPDVGGGFGLKAHVFPEEILVGWLALRLGRPVKWIEDRREHLAASMHAKHEIVRGELAAARDGTILAIRASILCDVGAYTEYPWPTFEPNVTAGAMTGPYRVPAFAYEATSIATNKASLGAYRGVGQPIGVLATERLIDLAAAKLGLDPADCRRRNMIRGDEHPYRTVLGTEIESGSHVECLDAALERIGYAGFRSEQAKAREAGRYVGIGIASYVEVTAPGSAVWQSMGPAVGGWESATVRLELDGNATVLLGVNSQGQGHATTFAQAAAETLGLRLADVRVVQGDTAITPRGWVAGGSRCAVACGGAVLSASGRLRDRLLAAASRLSELPTGALEIQGGIVRRAADGGEVVPVRELARAMALGRAGDDGPLEETARYEPPPLTHSNATHVVTVEVDVETGQVKCLRYVVAEDCGTMMNPLVVDGQIQGGVAQGIGAALYEELVYDENGQLLTGTLMDYLPPTSSDVPRVEIIHFETPSPYTLGGFKGMGEGGAIGPPGAIANAVADALAPFGARPTEIPLTPERVLALVDRARSMREGGE
ncbi:MAG: aerobic carbon-monoxide dehydrogenase large subunit [Candidatus Binatota bacterium]|nr:aerobic carbon-monoxide dehydrogenase large subunit [Candidatus Binatota bacterium]